MPRVFTVTGYFSLPSTALSSLREEFTTSDGGIPWADSVSVFTEAINSQRVPSVV